MQRYSRLLYRVSTPLMRRQIRPLPQFTPLIQVPSRSFARQGYLEDTQCMWPMIAPFDDVAVSKKMVGWGVLLFPMFATPYVLLVVYMFR